MRAIRSNRWQELIKKGALGALATLFSPSAVLARITNEQVYIGEPSQRERPGRFFKESNVKKLPVIFGLLLVSLLAACGTGAATMPASSPTQTLPASSPTLAHDVITSPIVGIYRMTITRQDIASMPTRSGDRGTYTIIFRDDSTYVLTKNGPGGTIVFGYYLVSQGEVSLTDTRSCGSLWNAPTGTYSWALRGNMLILQAQDEGCLDRQFVLESHPLLRQGA